MLSSDNTVAIVIAFIAPTIGFLSLYVLQRLKKQKPRRTVEDHLDTFLEALLAENKNLRIENEKKDAAIERRDIIIEKKDTELSRLRVLAASKQAKITEENER